uniref:Death ligand signal enhancer n=1 Tax=Phallusia mammillata TaxID=59560 RepID=A0A6F9DA79_9ASCI|nr:death ligand signal enhancer [Phallusia mammillata]
MYKILKGLIRYRARPPAPSTQTSKTDETEISNSAKEDEVHNVFQINCYDGRSGLLIDNQSREWHNNRKFSYDGDVNFRCRYWKDLVLGSATVWAVARYINDIHHINKPKSSYCIWKVLKEKSIKERLHQLYSSVTALPQLTVNNVLPRIPAITLPSHMVHAAGVQEDATSGSVLDIQVPKGNLKDAAHVLKNKKSVTIDPKFISNDPKFISDGQSSGVSSSRDRHLSTSSSTGVSDEDVEEFVSSTKRCIGLTYNIQGLNLFKSGKFEQAVESFSNGSIEGCSQAQYNLGLCFERGKGTDMDIEKAKKEYRKAASQGHKWAQYNLALILFDDNNAVQTAHGLYLLEEAAKQGMAEAQSLLGAKLAQPGLHNNMKKAVEMFKMASEQQDMLSTYHLAECQEHGLGGLATNPLQAYELYTTAAAMGHLDSKYKMALILAKGCDGLEQNEKLAMKLFQEAASAGHTPSKRRFEEIQRNRTIALKVETRPKEESTKLTNETAEILKMIIPELLHNLRMDLINEQFTTPPQMQDNKLFGPALLNTSLPRGLNMHRVATWPKALAGHK